MYHPQLVHAGFLLDIPWQQQILQQLLQLLDHNGGASSTPATQQPPGDAQQGRVLAQCQDAGHSTGFDGNLQGRNAGQDTSASGGPLAGQHGHGCTNVPHGLKGGFRLQEGAAAGTAPATHQNYCSDATQRPVHASGSSDSGSQCSFQSCRGGSSDTDSSDPGSSSVHLAPAAGLVSGGQQLLPKAASGTHPLSPFSAIAAGLQQQSSPGKGAGAPVLPAAASFGRSSYGSLKSYGSLGRNSTGSHLQPNSLTRSREGSLELTSPLCMRSWSGVLPTTSSAVWPTDISTGSAETSLVPESPRSVNTFVSASSVQSRRSLAAAAAAHEARQAAHALLQPLLALQQHTQQPWGAAGDNSSSKAHADVPGQHVPVKRTGNEFGSGAAAAAAGSIDCLVSYASCASAAGGKQAPPVQSTSIASASPRPVSAACAETGPAVTQPDSSPSEGAAGDVSQGQNGSLGLRLRAGFGRRSKSFNMGVLKRVEGFLQGRGTRAGDGSNVG
jgi:hypothetical protein